MNFLVYEFLIKIFKIHNKDSLIEIIEKNEKKIIIQVVLVL